MRAPFLAFLVLPLAACVTVNLPEVPPYHPAHVQAETGAIAPAPPTLDLSTAPPTASPGLPVPSPPDSEPGTIRSDMADETSMTGNIHQEHGMMDHDSHGGEHGTGQGSHNRDGQHGRPSSMDEQETATVRPGEPVAGGSTVVYTCPMHPSVRSDRPGSCPECGMVLHRQEVRP